MSQEQQLLQQLGGLIKELDYCCRCDERKACPEHAAALKRQWRDIPPPRKRKLRGFRFGRAVCRVYAIKTQPRGAEACMLNRAGDNVSAQVPFEIDWDAYPLVTGLPVVETRYKANMLEVGSEPPRVSVRYEPRAWLPKPVDLGGDGTPWDLRRYRSRELIGSRLHSGCACPKRNGLQDECGRWDCKAPGKDCCRSQPAPKCRPSGGPGECELPAHKMHKNNCWCDFCRPSCCPSGRLVPRSSNPDTDCPQCLCLQSVQCGSSCTHYCDKHMLGVAAKPCPPILY